VLVAGVGFGLLAALAVGLALGLGTAKGFAPSERSQDYWERRERIENNAIGLGACTGLVVLGASILLTLRYQRAARARAKANLAARIEELAANFPEEVQYWGGPAVLRDREIVRELFKQLKLVQLPDDVREKKLTAGLCGVFLGAFGAHKFSLGMAGPGVIHIFLNVFWGLGALLGLIEGIIYLTNSDEDFYRTYLVEKRPWF
jgi:TM2 domain-containing membrane protein YozV